ncbi:MAG: hypothetical protein K6E16_06450 [Lachnospiraceae bacterium]|nr:hypothetical protein [Lachnospiraceae bacterium]
MNLTSLLNEIVSQVGAPAFVRQALTILLLSVYGYVLLSLLCPSFTFRRRMLFAYPAGLSMFTLTSFLPVVLSIPYGTATAVIAALLALAVILGALFVRKYHKDPRCFSVLYDCSIKEAVMAIVLLDLAILLSCSGVLHIALSNDSIFNYSFYPRLIVHFGGLRPNFNTFLTDVGPGAAMVGTLPYLFGFQETFGLQHMLNLVFLAIFGVAVYEKCTVSGKKSRLLFAFSAVVLLLSSTPYLLLSKWILSNDYFAVFMFLCAYLADFGTDESRSPETREDTLWLLYILLAMLSLLRIEGGVYVILFVLCVSVRKIGAKSLAFGMLLPALVLQSLYAFRIFCTMHFIAPYRFLTEGKVLLMLAAMAATLLYLLLIRGRYCLKLQDHFGVLIMAGLFVLNLLLFVKDRAGYLENMRAFLENILRSGGWGIFPLTVALLFLISLGKRFRFGYWDLMAFGYFLYALAVSFMREGGLQAGPGDSGNRVLMQALPLLLFAGIIHVLQRFGERREAQE